MLPVTLINLPLETHTRTGLAYPWGNGLVQVNDEITLYWRGSVYPETSEPMPAWRRVQCCLSVMLTQVLQYGRCKEEPSFQVRHRTILQNVLSLIVSISYLFRRGVRVHARP